MNYAIETDIFLKEAATFPSIEKQTPNKETSQITPLCTSPGQPDCMSHLKQFLCQIKHFIPRYTGTEKAKGQISISVFNYFV